MKQILHIRLQSIKLLWLIVGLTIVSALVSLSITLASSYFVQRNYLINSTLNNHEAYSAKLADSIDDLILSLQQQLAYSAQQVASTMHDSAQLDRQVRLLQHQTNSFNSVGIVDAQGKLLANSLQNNLLIGVHVNSPGVQEALHKQKPLISSPYKSLIGNLVVFISQPIFDEKKNYLGLIGGAIYLRQDSTLKRILGKHFYRDGSYVFIVDKNRRIIEHPNHKLIGKYVQNNKVIDDIALGLGGQKRIINNHGVDVLTGYAIVKKTGWGVVSQCPTPSALALANRLIVDVVLISTPLALLFMIFIVWCARYISLPLYELAQSAHQMDQPQALQKINNARSWYFEATELKCALLVGINLIHRNISRLHMETLTDPLTGLANRRALDDILAQWIEQQQQFSVICVDVDHFKRVNDSFGHAVGDSVLKEIGEKLRTSSRNGDIACRVGGEEFLLLLPNAPSSVAQDVAERLRSCIEAHLFTNVGSVTISSGVANYPHDGVESATVLAVADARLYHAKKMGRNVVISTGIF